MSSAFTCIDLLCRGIALKQEEEEEEEGASSSDKTEILPMSVICGRLPFGAELGKLRHQRGTRSLGAKYFLFNVIQYLKSRLQYTREEAVKIADKDNGSTGGGGSSSGKKRKLNSQNSGSVYRPKKYLRLARITSKAEVQQSIK